MPTITANGIDFQVGDQGEGPALLLVHGFPLDHTMWSRQIACFAESHRVIAPDLRGFGKSGVSDGVVTMEQFADDLAAILDRLSVTEPVRLCGLSMGGYVAWQFFQRHRDRLAALILCDTRAGADSPEARRLRGETASRVLAEGPDFLAEAMVEKLFAEDTRREQPELVTATQVVIRRTSAGGIAAALHGMAVRPDVTPMLPNIDVPTLAICGEHDILTPSAEMRTMAGMIPRAEFVEVPDAGHMAPLEAPAAVNQAMDSFFRAS